MASNEQLRRALRAAACTVGLVVGLVSGQTKAPARAVTPLAGKRFHSFLWRYGGPPLGRAFAETLRRAGVSGVVVDQNEDPRPVVDLGLAFYLDHAAGKGTLHLRERVFREKREAYEASRSPAELLRPNPLSSWPVRSKLLRLVRARVGRAAPMHPAMVSLDDEISVTRLANPLDFSFNESTLKGFRSWLHARYGDVSALNVAWQSRFRSFAEVVPPTTDAVRKRELIADWPIRLTDWSDHREYMDIVLASTLALLARESRQVAPATPVGFEGGQPPAAFGGHDWRRLLSVVDFVEPYDIGGTRALVRSLARPGTLHYETVFPEEDPLLARRSVARLYDALAHGLNGVILWSADAFFAKHPAKGQGATPISDPTRLSVFGKLLARDLPRVCGTKGALLAGARVFSGDVVILESQASVRLHWMLDSARDGKSWTRRFGTYERAHSTSQAARLSWVRLLQDLGYGFRFVTPGQLTQRNFGGRRAPRVLVLPSCLALSEQSLRTIVAFAEAGGLVVADETPGRYDERLRLRSRPPLDELFGIARRRSVRHLREGRLVGAPRLSSGLGIVETGLEPEGITVGQRASSDVQLAQRSGLQPWVHSLGTDRADWCQLERTVGRGRVMLLNLGVAEYAATRLIPSFAASCRDLRTRVRRVLDRHGVEEIALASVRGYPTILERVLLGKDGRRILAVRANCLENPALFKQLVERGPQPLRIVLPVAARVRDLWTGKPLGVGRHILTKLDPVRGCFLLVEPL